MGDTEFFKQEFRKAMGQYVELTPEEKAYINNLSDEELSAVSARLKNNTEASAQPQEYAIPEGATDIETDDITGFWEGARWSSDKKHIMVPVIFTQHQIEEVLGFIKHEEGLKSSRGRKYKLWQGLHLAIFRGLKGLELMSKVNNRGTTIKRKDAELAQLRLGNANQAVMIEQYSDSIQKANARIRELEEKLRDAERTATLPTFPAEPVEPVVPVNRNIPLHGTPLHDLHPDYEDQVRYMAQDLHHTKWRTAGLALGAMLLAGISVVSIVLAVHGF